MYFQWSTVKKIFEVGVFKQGDVLNANTIPSETEYMKYLTASLG